MARPGRGAAPNMTDYEAERASFVSGKIRRTELRDQLRQGLP